MELNPCMLLLGLLVSDSLLCLPLYGGGRYIALLGRAKGYKNYMKSSSSQFIYAIILRSLEGLTRDLFT